MKEYVYTQFLNSSVMRNVLTLFLITSIFSTSSAQPSTDTFSSDSSTVDNGVDVFRTADVKELSTDGLVSPRVDKTSPVWGS